MEKVLLPLISVGALEIFVAPLLLLRHFPPTKTSIAIDLNLISVVGKWTSEHTLILIGVLVVLIGVLVAAVLFGQGM